MMSLLCLLAAMAAASAFEVQVQLTPLGQLQLTLTQGDNARIGAVAFIYNINGRSYKGRGVQTREGWQFESQGLVMSVDAKVSAYAQLYDVTGQLRLTTQRFGWADLNLADPAAHSRLPARQIRSTVLFRDDFNSFDKNNWDTEVSMYGGMNWEFQVYTNDNKNVFVKDGKLHLMPTKTVDDSRFSGSNFLKSGTMDMSNLFGSCTQSANYGCSREGKYGLLPPVMSGKVKSSASLKYGTVTVRARIPSGDWLWPAIWMLPKSDSYGGWPKSGEIDIMESRGNQGDIGVGSVASTLHWGPDFNNNRYTMTTGAQKTSDWSSQFHTWKLVWTQDHIITYVDDVKIMEVNPGSSFWDYGNFNGNNIWGSNKMAPFDQEFYMIFNVAVGGTNGFFPDGNHYGGTTKPWANTSPQAAEDFWNARSAWGATWQDDKVGMIVDYVQFETL